VVIIVVVVVVKQDLVGVLLSVTVERLSVTESVCSSLFGERREVSERGDVTTADIMH
jgi:hypothetical protein